MSTAQETVVQCGHIDARGLPRRSMRMQLNRELSVDLGGIDARLNGKVRPVFRDLIRVAAYVLGADCAVKRGTVDDTDFGVRWRRNFRFVIGVEAPEVSRPALVLLKGGKED